MNLVSPTTRQAFPLFGNGESLTRSLTLAFLRRYYRRHCHGWRSATEDIRLALLASPPHALDSALAPSLETRVWGRPWRSAATWETGNRRQGSRGLGCRCDHCRCRSRVSLPHPSLPRTKRATKPRLVAFAVTLTRGVATPHATGSEVSLGFVSAHTCRTERKIRVSLPRPPPPLTGGPLGRYCRGQVTM